MDTSSDRLFAMAAAVSTDIFGRYFAPKARITGVLVSAPASTIPLKVSKLYPLKEPTA